VRQSRAVLSTTATCNPVATAARAGQAPAAHFRVAPRVLRGRGNAAFPRQMRPVRSPWRRPALPASAVVPGWGIHERTFDASAGASSDLPSACAQSASRDQDIKKRKNQEAGGVPGTLRADFPPCKGGIEGGLSRVLRACRVDPPPPAPPLQGGESGCPGRCNDPGTPPDCSLKPGDFRASGARSASDYAWLRVRQAPVLGPQAVTYRVVASVQDQPSRCRLCTERDKRSVSPTMA